MKRFEILKRGAWYKISTRLREFTMLPTYFRNALQKNQASGRLRPNAFCSIHYETTKNPSYCNIPLCNTTDNSTELPFYSQRRADSANWTESASCFYNFNIDSCQITLLP